MLVLLPLLLFLQPVRPISDSSRELITKWAPRVWMHDEEVFNPSTVAFHLKNMEVRDASEQVQAGAPLTPSSVPRGEETSTWHLNTPQDLECVNCFRDFFSGQPLDQVPSYAFVTEHNDSCATVDVTYSLFYPFNYGKDVCVGIDTGGLCLGEVKTFGNHVGDWEHVSLRLQGGQPREIYLGVHRSEITFFFIFFISFIFIIFLTLIVICQTAFFLSVLELGIPGTQNKVRQH